MRGMVLNVRFPICFGKMLRRLGRTTRHRTLRSVDGISARVREIEKSCRNTRSIDCSPVGHVSKCVMIGLQEPGRPCRERQCM